jgi:shikimate kinase
MTESPRPAKRVKHPEIRCNLALIGGRGCGKTSISKRVALANRGFMLFSTDAMIRYEAGGRTIPEIVEEHGWHRFRDFEFEVIEKLTRMKRGVLLDCGGGVVVDLDDRGEEHFSERKVERLRADGIVVYLKRDHRFLADKVAGDPNRPDLSASKSFLEIMERREPWYTEAAHHVIECGDASKSEIAAEIVKLFYRETGHDLSKVKLKPLDA